MARKHLRRLAPALGLALAAAGVPAAQAAIFAYTSWGDGPGSPDDVFATQPNAVSIFNDPVHVEHVGGGVQNGITYSAQGSANNAGGVLSFHAASGLSATNTTLPGNYSSIALGSGGFTDQVVIHGVDGETGFIRLAVGYDGSVSGVSSATYQALAYMSACASAVTCVFDPDVQLTVLANITGGPGSQTVSGHSTIGAIAFQYNVPFYVTAYLAAVTAFRGAPGASLEASASFLNTARLSAIDVRRADGSRDVEAKITSLASGDSYATVVPEPQAWGLMILGFGLAGAALRRVPRQLAA